MATEEASRRRGGASRSPRGQSGAPADWGTCEARRSTGPSRDGADADVVRRRLMGADGVRQWLDEVWQHFGLAADGVRQVRPGQKRQQRPDAIHGSSGPMVQRQPAVW
ncbi:hypothetical protein VPH35_110278 [Triticum aestivum]